ncbi:MAG: hypothetical protein ALECFALPRED_001837 [Alectoria fallacina]|uniref:Uncharacterized protein n=1 Tax=Alectoria fallacina TaxID=1903189 RepID=A0A8H3FF67_9LECA|nr:MAG: hypothetical protein ALECFALPRED_001837 [Alectoria fallacina]
MNLDRPLEITSQFDRDRRRIDGAIRHGEESLSDIDRYSRRDEDLEDGLRAVRYGREHDLGVGPGVELPTRMHYYEEEIVDHELVHETPGRGLRRVSVVHFGSLPVRTTLVKRFSSQIFHSELEERPFDLSHQFNPRPRRRSPHKHFQHDDHRTSDHFEESHGQVGVFGDDSVAPEQVAFHNPLKIWNNEALGQLGFTMPHNPPIVQIGLVDSPAPRPVLPDNDPNGTAEEAPRDWGASPGHVPQANGKGVWPDDIQSIGSSVSEDARITTPEHSDFGSEFGDSTSGSSDSANVGDNDHSDDDSGLEDI